MATSPHPALGEPIPESDIKRLMHANLMWRIEASEIVSTAPDWAAADAAMRVALSGHRAVDEQYQREQTAAGVMLHAYLLRGPRDPERLHALAYYTQLLVTNRSPEASLIADALERLKDHLTEEEIRQLAGDAALSAERLAGVRLQCRGCSYEEMLKRLPESASNQMLNHSASILQNVARLQALARPHV